MATEVPFHFPPELFELLVDTVPYLGKSKQGVLDFFRNVGTPGGLLVDLQAQVRQDRQSIARTSISRQVLTALNQGGDTYLAVRRQLIKRVVEFEDFSVCWREEADKAQLNVERIRRLVKVKDTFTRLADERDEEARKHREAREAALADLRARRERVDRAKQDFYRLFPDPNVSRRGTRLDSVIASLFSAFEIQVREPFVLRSPSSGQILEQIDGMIELDGRYFLTEAKWESGPLEIVGVAEHLRRVFSRPDTHALFIVANGPTEAAIAACGDAFANRRIVAIVLLRELVAILEQGQDLKEFLRSRILDCLGHKHPLGISA